MNKTKELSLQVAREMDKDLVYLDTLMQGLISSYPTYLSDGSGILAAQEIVSSSLKTAGFAVSEASVTEETIINDPSYVKVEDFGQDFAHYSPNKHPSIIGKLDIDSTAPTFGMNGHVDVEPVFDLSQWKHKNEWRGGKIIDSEYYGRGSTDMLGGVAGMLFALRHVLGLKTIKPKTNLVFHSVADEEIGGNGTLKCLLTGSKPDWVVIAEPTELSVCNSSLGFHHFSYTTIGKAVHMAHASVSQNALDVAIAVYNRLTTSTRKRFQQEISQSSGYATTQINPLTCGRILGGNDPAIPAETCLLEGVVFSSPTQRKEEVFNILAQVPHDPTTLPAELCMSGMSFPGAFSGDSYIPTLIDHAGDIFHQTIPHVGFPSPCDMRLYSQNGIPATIFGPGSLTSAHAANESLNRAELIIFTKMFASLLIDLWTD